MYVISLAQRETKAYQDKFPNDVVSVFDSSITKNLRLILTRLVIL
jgi:hypothetical protein